MFTQEDVSYFFDIGSNTGRISFPEGGIDMFRVFGKDNIAKFDDGHCEKFKDKDLIVVGPNSKFYNLIAFSNLWYRGVKKGYSTEVPEEIIKVTMINTVPLMIHFAKMIFESKLMQRELQISLPEEFKDDKIAQSIFKSFTQKPYCLEAFCDVVFAEGKTNKPVVGSSPKDDGPSL